MFSEWVLNNPTTASTLYTLTANVLTDLTGLAEALEMWKYFAITCKVYYLTKYEAVIKTSMLEIFKLSYNKIPQLSS